MNPVRPAGTLRRGPTTKLEPFFFFPFLLPFRRRFFELPVELLTLYWGAEAVCIWGRDVKSIFSFSFSPFFFGHA